MGKVPDDIPEVSPFPLSPVPNSLALPISGSYFGATKWSTMIAIRRTVGSERDDAKYQVTLQLTVFTPEN